MRNVCAIGVAALLAGCGGYTGDRTPAVAGGGAFGPGAESRAPAGNRGLPADAVAYTVLGGEKPQLRIIDARGGADRLLGELTAEIPAAAFDARRERFVFAARAGEGKPFGVYAAPALRQEGAQELVPPAYAGVAAIRVAADGKTVAFVATKKDSPSTLYVLRDKAKAAVALDPADDVALAPRGDAFVVSRGGRLSIGSLRTGKIAPLGKAPVAGVDPAFSPDSKRIVFARAEGEGQFDLYTISLNGSGLERVTNTPGLSERAPLFARDGKRIVYTAFEKGRATGAFVLTLGGKNAPVAVRTPQAAN